MNKLGAFDYAAKLGPRIRQVRRKTWIMIGLGLFATFALAIWCTVVLVGWLWGQTQTLASGAPNLIRDAANAVLADAKVLVPDAKQALDGLAAPAVAEAKQALAKAEQALAAVAQANQTLDPVSEGKQALAALIPSVLGTSIPAVREVSGSDLGPVPRFPGMQRTRWEQKGTNATVEFEGRANFLDVLDHYRSGMAKLGYSEAVRAASAKMESHEYTRNGERIQMELSQLTAGRVKVRIDALRAERASAELEPPKNP